MPSFRTARNIELSTVAYIQTQINASWTGVTTVKSFTNAYKTSLPVVCVRLFDEESFRKEIGSTTFRHQYSIIIDIFATSDGQRIDLADFILSSLEDVWTYNEYSHNPANPEVLTTAATSKIRLLRLETNNKVDFGEEVDSYDRFRQNIVVRVEKTV